MWNADAGIVSGENHGDARSALSEYIQTRVTTFGLDFYCQDRDQPNGRYVHIGFFIFKLLKIELTTNF